MAVENVNGTPSTRLPDEATKADAKGIMPPPKTVKLDEAANVIQVLSSKPAKVVELHAELEEHEVEHEEELKKEPEPATNDAELLPFDWEDLRVRYTQSLREANEVEETLLAQFEQYSEAFRIWAEASSEHDNERAQKRLKTREFFVQISEQELEDKKVHYTEVVNAFKGAMVLLNGPSPRQKARPRHR